MLHSYLVLYVNYCMFINASKDCTFTSIYELVYMESLLATVSFIDEK